MPWNYILGGASGAGIVLVLAIFIVPKIIERMVQSQLDIKLQELRGVQSRDLEFDKSELEVWAGIRKEVLTDMWVSHREIVKAMTSVILRTQDFEQLAEQVADPGKLELEIKQYRHTIHNSIDLISPEGIDICQHFLEIAYNISSGRQIPDDANTLKTMRGKFYEYTAAFYGLEKMIPWMARSASRSA